jgi:hypothetical protein
MCWADRTTLWRALRVWAVQLLYQAVIQPDRMLSTVHMQRFEGFRCQANSFSLLRLKRRSFPTIVYRQIFSLIIHCITIPVCQKFTYTNVDVIYMND